MREKAISLCLIPQILHNLREGVYHHCLGKDPEIPQKERFERVIQGISEFHFENLQKNSRAVVDQRTRDMVLDLTTAKTLESILAQGRARGKLGGVVDAP